MASNAITNNLIASISSTNSEANCVTVASVIPKIRIALDPGIYNLQRLCKVCNCEIRDSKLNVKSKKQRCKFCF